MILLYIFLFSLVLNCVSLQNANPIVQINDGKLEGVWDTTSENRRFAAFKGVPYANPPNGEYRFKDPRPVTKWSGVRNATVYGAPCLYLEGTLEQIFGDEDCLFLNIFTPILDSKAKLPVVVFIHGGDFMSGSGDLYNPVRLMNYDMIIITLNYRLGPLGFFSTGDDVVAGNAGLKDQAFALQWIQRNIKNFGGDPDSVTLTGHSTGSACVYYHYLSPWSHGTFHRGIAYSGSALAPWALDDYPVEKGRTLANIVGCPYTTSRAMIQCLRSKPAADIANAQLQMRDNEFQIYKIFQPVIESPKVHNPFLAENPYRAAISGKMSKLPLMMTTTREEGLIPAAAYQAAPQLLPRLDERWVELASYFLDYNRTLPKSRSAEVAKKIKDFYFSGEPISLDTFWPLVRVVTDRIYQADIGKLVQIHANLARVPVYVYEYSFAGSYSISNILSNSSVIYGAAHTDDILHLFILYGITSNSTGDLAMNKVMGDMLYSYASTR
nr:venom polypeptide precursor [Doratifera vulnerans]